MLFFRVNKMNVNLWCLQADSGEDENRKQRMGAADDFLQFLMTTLRAKRPQPTPF